MANGGQGGGGALLLWGIGALLLVGGGAVVYTMTRGLRNNNPGNIEYNPDPSQQWEGLASPPNDGVYAVFTDSKYGIRALAHLLNTYYTRYGLTSVMDIITKWAPPAENDTAAYIADVAGQLGVDPTTALDFTDPTTFEQMVAAIIRHENGLNPYSDAQIQAGIALV